MAGPAAVNDSYEVAGRTFPFAHRYSEALSGARPLEGVVSLPVYAGDAVDAHAPAGGLSFVRVSISAPDPHCSDQLRQEVYSGFHIEHLWRGRAAVS